MGLGIGGDTTTNFTRILGDVNSNGRLELTNNITTNEGIRLAGRHAGSAASGGPAAGAGSSAKVAT